MSEDYFIQEATSRNKGRLRKFAKANRAIGKNGDIDLAKVERAAERIKNPKSRLQRIREVNLARTLRRLNR